MCTSMQYTLGFMERTSKPPRARKNTRKHKKKEKKEKTRGKRKRKRKKEKLRKNVETLTTTIGILYRIPFFL